ncbi:MULTISPECIES: DJ-1/PfpI family protein [unclassified Pseudomonas]|uniref:DJ-1/PfpI family protein n=1 Tax=unclassified Pseudomonas TaxID=196821 RepID=UPI0024487E4C|nr:MULTISPECIES: DJ-1/PfpI family protein [unclassified Pseudomonas]MDG9922047.1 DJ-1/PfpI family protein [Pseudomonas sp. GD04045]MDH0033860.1 DJ-1/PfpI family protein [Pseudomonas sp. GD04019]
MRPALLAIFLLFSLPVLGDERLPAYEPRFGRERPLVAVVGDNRMTELADYLVPYGILGRADVAELVALARDPGAIEMMPALHIQAQASLAEFDRDHPEGADYLIVPAVHHSDDPRLTAWLAAQASKGATLLAICDGVLLLGHAGLLQGRRATGHWYSREEREALFPETDWQTDRRYVVDGRIVSSAGISAAVPLSLALVEAIAGTPLAERVAREIGAQNWSSRHASGDFAFSSGDYLTVAGNWLAFWRHQRLGLVVTEGFDEVALALRADAYGRTFRSEVLAAAAGPVRSHSGLLLLPQQRGSDLQLLPEPDRQTTAIASLELALRDIAERYGTATERLVMQQLEYPRTPH